MSVFEVNVECSAATVEAVHCPNCGKGAERHHLSDRQLIQVQCPHCDYLMVTCAATGNVREAYAPGIAAY
ncbi:replication restart DNA helicase PriA [Vacuolonema iberomarrocanum]|uniref:replication restart DNA helicase PriA n=1 Tax=Vacuolonema iberomarrocanum TaxID=3454632 RepID=UPI0019E1EA38|nr:replication restart DNA helicase PriA [filamentous cyanobacterium LEGE 07170]